MYCKLNVNSESRASAILNKEDEASLEFNGQEFDGTKLQERLPSLHDISCGHTTEFLPR